MKDKITKNFICLVYPIAALCYTATLASKAVRPGVILAGVMAAALVCMLLQKFIYFKTTEDRIFTIYFAYNLASGIWCTAFGIPVSVFLGEVVTTALPMVFYLAGRGFKDDDAEKFYHGYILSALFLGGLGVVLNAWAPKFYLDYSFDNLFISKADAATARVRMNSVIGSGALGCMLAYAVCLSVLFISKKDKKSKITGVIYLAGSVVFAFMANQRASMAAIIIALVFYNVIAFAVYKSLPLKYLLAEIGGVVVLIAGIFFGARGVFDKVMARLESIPSGFGERSVQWISAVNNMCSIWLGDGLGSHGHRSAPYQMHVVADGGLVKIYAEMGLIGTSLMIFMVILVYKKALGKLRRLSCEIAVISSAILISLGSNVLTFLICAPIVYFALGRAVRIIYEESEGGAAS